MRFAATQNFAAFLMAMAGLCAAALGGGSSTAAWLAIAAGLGAAFVPQSWMAARVWQMVWSASTLAGLAVALLAIGATGSFLLPIHVFVLYLVVVKLYNRRRAEDYFHLYLTSLMALVGSAATNFGPSFVACLVVHLIASFWTLSLYQLRKDLETTQLVRHKSPGRSRPLALDRVLGSKRIVTPRFLLGSSLAALGALAFAAFFFLVFPRFGVAGFNPDGPKQGFARRVDLGGIGLVRDDPRLVMRVRLEPRPPDPVAAAIHWRAATLDRYAGGRWARSRLPVTGAKASGRSVWSCEPDRKKLERLEAQGRLLHQRILALPETDGLLPTAFPNFSLSILRPTGAWNIGPSIDGSGAAQSPWPDRPVLYEAVSVLGSTGPSPAAPWSALPCAGPPALDRRLRLAYLSLPQQSGRSLLALARRIANPQDPPMRRIQAALAYLSPENGFSYTRRLPRIPEGWDPVLYFLEHSKRGHCEYFASGLALLLRAMGLPARLAVGYLGGRWNPYGNFLAVRRGDAHAWTEVWLENRGWVLLDATPPEGRRPAARPGLWAKIALWFDAMRIAYLRWVVDYDTMTQFHVLRRAGRSVPWRMIGKGLGLAVALFLLLVVGRAAYREFKARHSVPTQNGGKTMRAAARPLKRLLAAARPWIGRKPEGRTLRAHLALLPDRVSEARSLALQAVDAYYEIRFAPLRREPADQAKPKGLERMRQAATQAARLLREQRPPSPV